MKNESWYGVKCIFRHNHLVADKKDHYVYEERIVIVLASNEDEAIALAEKEAKEYGSSPDSDYLHFATSFHTYEEKIVHLSEAYSEMRQSSLEPDEYLDYFYDTGNERVRKS